MGRNEGSERVADAVIVDLHQRLQRAARGLSSTADLRSVLDHLLRVLGEGTGIERIVLAVGDREAEPRILAASLGTVGGLDAYALRNALVREVYRQSVSVRSSGAVSDGARPAGRGDTRARFGAPLIGDGRPIGVVVGESAPDAALGAADEVVVESMALLLSPLLLIHRHRESDRELERLRSDFISRVSHELRTPLTIISGFAATLGAHEESLTAEQRHAMLDRIVTASVRLEHLVEEVLRLASVEAGLTDPHPRSVQVGDVVDLALHDRGGAGRADVHGPQGLKIVTDPDVARAVLGPLIENALQHAGSVTVRIEARPSSARIAIEDDGPGVPPELGDRIFERFVRGDDRSPGMGLGLAIARRMADTIGAQVWFEEVPRGARFVAELPQMSLPSS